jgi:hypothetical protein
MERIQALINRLQEQVAANADAGQLQATMQMLQVEINQLQHSSGKTLGTSKVAVVMPASSVTVAPQPVPKPESKSEPKAEPIPEKEQPTYSYPKVKAKNNNQLDLHFDPMNDIPTFSQYNPGKDVNDAIGGKESLNDRLNENKTELMHVLKDTPIRDLRKAIGINDRFVFINDLFRGDEVMYERSIKTINSFNIFPEAEYWMTRELQIKLGWDKEKEIVQHFYQLVKRRFS